MHGPANVSRMGGWVVWFVLMLLLLLLLLLLLVLAARHCYC